MLYQLSRDQKMLHKHQQPTHIAVAVDSDADCDGCYFRNRYCPTTQTGCAACTPDVRGDKQNIVWQVAP